MRHTQRNVIKNLRADGDINVVIGAPGAFALGAGTDPEDWWNSVGIDEAALVWRDELANAVDAFVADRERGYLLIEGVAGVGKSVFAYSLARRRGWPVYFVGRGPKGSLGLAAAASSIAAQVVRKRGLSRALLEPFGFESRSPALWQRVFELTEATRSRRDPLVIVLDGLDEDEPLAGRNVLSLPEGLPRNIYVIATQRPGAAHLRARDVYSHTIDPLGDENERALRRCIETVVGSAGLEPPLAQRVVDVVSRHAHGIWIYAHLVLEEMRSGRRGWSDLDGLPDGLWRYFANSWIRFREPAADWRDFYLPLIATLAAVQQPFTAPGLARLAGIENAVRVARLLRGEWSAFMAFDDSETFRLVHQSVGEFLNGDVDVGDLPQREADFVREISAAATEAHGELASRVLRAWGGLEEGLPVLIARLATDALHEDDEYGIRNLVRHLIRAGRLDEVHTLLSAAIESHDEHENVISRGSVWFSVHDRAGDVDGFATDVERAWKQVPIDGDRSDVLLHLRYALMLGTVSSSAALLPAGLLAALATRGILTVQQAASYARRMPEPGARARALLQLAPLMDEHERVDVTGEARYLASAILDRHDKLGVLAALIAQSPTDEAQALVDEAFELTNDRKRVRADTTRLYLAARSSEKQFAEVVDELVGVICDEPDSFDELWPLLARAVDEPQIERIAAAVAGFDNSFLRAQAYLDLAVYASRERAERLIEQGRVAIAQMDVEQRPPWHRAQALERLASLADDSEREGLLDEVEALLDGPPGDVVEFKHEDEDIARAVEMMMSASPNDHRFYVARGYRMLALHRPDRAERYGKSALEAALNVPDPTWRFDALVAIAGFESFPEAIRQAATGAALEAMFRARDRQLFLGQLDALADRLDEAQLREALAAARRIGDVPLQAFAAVTLLLAASESAEPAVRNALLDEACRRLRWSADGHRRAELIAAASRLPSAERYKQLLAAAAGMSDPRWRAVALADLLPHLPRKLIKAATAIADTIDKEHFAAPVRIAVEARAGEKSPPKRKQELAIRLTAELARVAKIRRGPSIEIGGNPFDPKPQAGEVFAAGARAIVKLWPESFDGVLTVVVKHPDRTACAHGLTRLAEDVPERAADVLLAALRSCPGVAPEVFSAVRVDLVTDELVEAVLAIGDDDLLAELLDSLGASLSAIQLAQAVERIASGELSLELAIPFGKLIAALEDREYADRLLRQALRATRQREVRFVLTAHRFALSEGRTRRRRRRDLRRRCLWLARRGLADLAVLATLTRDELGGELDDLLVLAAEHIRDVSARPNVVIGLLEALHAPSAKRRLVAWGGAAVLDASPEVRFEALLRVIEYGGVDALPYDGWAEAWKSAAAIFIPQNRMAALGALAALDAGDPDRRLAGLIATLPLLTDEGRHEVLFAVTEVAPMLARTFEGDAILDVVRTIGMIGWMWR